MNNSILSIAHGYNLEIHNKLYSSKHTNSHEYVPFANPTIFRAIHRSAKMATWQVTTQIHFSHYLYTHHPNVLYKSSLHWTNSYLHPIDDCNLNRLNNARFSLNLNAISNATSLHYMRYSWSMDYSYYSKFLIKSFMCTTHRCYRTGPKNIL